jgi:catechol 2,3-dioxygenase-like lactoylglutathione lyase family enzyme
MERENVMKLGQFSISLAVEDLGASREFYKKLGFEVVPGEDFEHGAETHIYDRDWVILKNGEGAMLGLFQGMFEKNTLTFNPPDVRAIQRSLKEQGVQLTMEADESSSGPASAFLIDPDGNPVLLDQHDG